MNEHSALGFVAAIGCGIMESRLSMYKNQTFRRIEVWTCHVCTLLGSHKHDATASRIIVHHIHQCNKTNARLHTPDVNLVTCYPMTTFANSLSRMLWQSVRTHNKNETIKRNAPTTPHPQKSPRFVFCALRAEVHDDCGFSSCP